MHLMVWQLACCRLNKDAIAVFPLHRSEVNSAVVKGKDAQIIRRTVNDSAVWRRATQISTRFKSGVSFFVIKTTSREIFPKRHFISSNLGFHISFTSVIELFLNKLHFCRPSYLTQMSKVCSSHSSLSLWMFVMHGSEELLIEGKDGNSRNSPMTESV